MKKTICLILLTLILTTACLTACQPQNEGPCVFCEYCKKCTQDHPECDVCTCEELEIEHTQWNMLEGTPYQTAVHKFATNKPGPAIVIVGGIHGDERAGWTAGLELVECLTQEKAIRGTIFVIPEANVMADRRGERFPGRSKINNNGIVTVDGVEYSDINRAFPIGRNDSILTDYSLTVSEGIRTTVEKIIAENDVGYIVDLHEAQKPYPDSLGHTLIGSNDPIFMMKLIHQYNDNYRPADEQEFSLEPAIQQGSFSRYFTETYPDKVVYTIETNRQCVGTGASKVDTISLEVRTRQQLNILRAMFDLIWER